LVGRGRRALFGIAFAKTRLLAQRIEPDIDRRQSAESTIRIYLRETRPFRRQLVFGEDRFDRAFRHARVAVDTGFRMNHQHVVVEMKRVHRTNQRAIGIATIDARFSNDVGH